MPVAHATQTSQLVETGGLPSTIEGVITRVPVAPLDYGRLFTGKHQQDWSPFELGAYIHIKPNDGGDILIVSIKMTNWGGLQYAIAATEDVDPNSHTSDIAYPGDPSDPDGMDMDAFHEAAEALWHKVDGDVTLYHQALIETYGGTQPFSIGRHSGLSTRTDWEFFLQMGEKLTNWREAVDARLASGDIPFFETPKGRIPRNPHGLLTGARCKLEKVEVPGQGKKSAMKDDKPARAWKIHVLTQFDEYVDVGTLDGSKSTSASGTSASTPSGTSASNESAQFEDALIESLANEGELDHDAIKKVALAFPKGGLRKFAVKMAVKAGDNSDFYNAIDGAEWDKDTLTLTLA